MGLSMRINLKFIWAAFVLYLGCLFVCSALSAGLMSFVYTPDPGESILAPILISQMISLPCSIGAFLIFFIIGIRNKEYIVDGIDAWAE